MRTSPRRKPLTLSLVLLGTVVLFAGCGEGDSYMPAGSSGASTIGASGVGAVTTPVDDPVMAGYDGIDSGVGSDDPFARASTEWDEGVGALGGIDDLGLDDLDDGYANVGYRGGAGYGYGYDDGLGYGGSMLGVASAGLGGAGLMDAGLMDAGFEDPGVLDAGFDDPGLVDPGFDAGIADVGFDPGFDAGIADVGFDPGFADVGAVDVGGFDPGFGAVDIGAVDVGGFDAGIVF